MDWALSFAIESWTLFSFTTLVVLARMGLRIWHLGIRNLQLDDYGMVISLVGYTARRYGGTLLNFWLPGFLHGVSGDAEYCRIQCGIVHRNFVPAIIGYVKD
ncbi:hypothetical protein BP6252_11046 [Coleophoma cylindrospora]|uniref:Uncharacterized protein n=1 Tax=Coleophoma cylindrospora TaxID=1849047 RepID=A0A3D8QP49_9HELO|nr:hypothetical protein BP6252_11046 [Coleophoma cylindrospora]